MKGRKKEHKIKGKSKKIKNNNFPFFVWYEGQKRKNWQPFPYTCSEIRPKKESPLLSLPCSASHLPGWLKFTSMSKLYMTVFPSSFVANFTKRYLKSPFFSFFSLSRYTIGQKCSKIYQHFRIQVFASSI